MDDLFGQGFSAGIIAEQNEVNAVHNGILDGIGVSMKRKMSLWNRFCSFIRNLFS
jgi:hypothetical protein